MAQVEAAEHEAKYLSLRQLSRDVSVRFSDPLDIPPQASASNLFCISNRKGLAIAATKEGFLLHPLSQVRQLFTSASRNTTPKLESPLRSVPTTTSAAISSRPSFLRLGDAESSLVAGFENGAIAVWNLDGLVGGSALEPSFVLQPPSAGLRLLDVAPNPSDRPELCVALYAQPGESSVDAGTAIVLDIRQGSWGAQLETNSRTSCLSWSVKGKQVALGLESGEIAQLTPEGEEKARIPRPSDLEGQYYVDDLRWLENHVFLATYNLPASSSEPEHSYEVFTILREPKSSQITSVKYLMDPAPAFGDAARKGKRFIGWLKGWEPTKHLLFVGNSPSADIGLLGCLSNDASGPTPWANLELEETSRPSLPFSSIDKSADTAPVGLEFDLTASEEALDPRTASGGDDEKRMLGPMPILMVYTTDGVLIAYHVINTEGGQYPGMTSSEAATAEASMDTAPVTPAGTSTPVAATTSAPAAASASPFPFGTSTAAPAFGQSSGFGAFRSGAIPAPAFGQPSTPGGAVGSSAASPASAFGAPSTQRGGGFGSFSSPSSSPAFGQPSQPASSSPSGSPFGSGGALPSTGSGNAAFGAFGSKPSAFGSGSTSFSFGGATQSTTSNAASSPAPAFSSPSTPATSGALSSAPAFGSPSGFGTAAKSTSAFGAPSAFGAAAGGATPAFGQTSFGQPSTPKPTFGAPSAFGATSPAPQTPSPGAAPISSSSDAGSGGFGGFGSSTGSGFGGFAQKGSPFGTAPASADGSIFGSGGKLGTSSSTSAFGASTPAPAFGKSAFGQPATPTPSSASAFSFGNASAAQNKEKAGEKKREEGAKDDGKDTGSFSFGGLGNMLGEDKPAKDRKADVASKEPSMPFSLPYPVTESSPTPQADETETPRADGGASPAPTATPAKDAEAKTAEPVSRESTPVAPAFGGFGSSSGFSFGSKPATPPASDAEATKPASAFSFGPSPSASAFSFGNKPSTPTNGNEDKDKDKKEEKPFSAFSSFGPGLGAGTAFTSQPFSFGPKKAETGTSSAFATSGEQKTFSFGSPGTTPETELPAPTTAAKPFSFGTPKTEEAKKEAAPAVEKQQVEEHGTDDSARGADADESREGEESQEVERPSDADADAKADETRDADESHDADETQDESQDADETTGDDTRKLEESFEGGDGDESADALSSSTPAGTPTKQMSSLLSRLSSAPSPAGADGQREEDDEEEGEEEDGDESQAEIKVKEEPQSPPSLSPPPPSAQKPASPFSFGQTSSAAAPSAPAPAPASSGFSFAPQSQNKPAEGFSFGRPSGSEAPATATPPVSKAAFGAGPAPSSKPANFFGFNSRAPRSSSPLASAPVTRADFSPSPEKKREQMWSELGQEKEQQAKEAPKPTFDLGKFAAPAASRAQPFSAPSPSPSAPSSFGLQPQSQPQPPAAPSAPPSFSFGAPPAQSFGAQVPKASPFARTASPAAAPPATFGQPGSLAPPGSLAAPNGRASPTQRASSPSFAAGPVPATPSLPPPVSAAPARVPERERVSASSFADVPPPRLGAPGVSGLDPSEVQETGIAGEFLKTYLVLNKELEVLRSNVRQCATFLGKLREPTGLPESSADFSDQALWTFGDLKTMVKLAGQMTGETDRLTAQSIAQKRQLTELQSLILKAETKREEAARFLRARADPEFAKMVKVRQLGPEHVENQQRLRKTSGMVRERIQELDEYLVLLKNRVTDEKLGRAPMKAPSLDSIQRAVRNISTSVTERIYEMDELAMQMEMARLSAPTPRAESRARDTRSMSRSRAFDSILDLSEALPKHGAISHAAASRSAATAVAADQASKDIKAVFLAARAEPILNRSAIRQTDGAGKNAGSRKDWDSSDLQMAFARGPVTLGQRVAPSPAPAAAQAAPAVAPAAPNFGPGASPSANSRVDAPAGPSSKPAFCFATPPALPQDIFSLPPETLPFAPGSRDSASLSASSGIHAHAKPNRRAGAPRAVPLPTRASASPTAPPSTFFSSGQGVGGGAFGSGSSTTSTSSGSGAPAPANFFGPPPPFTPPVTRPRGPDFTTFQGLEQPKPLISTSTERASPRTPQRLEEVVSPAAVDEDELEDDEEYPYDEEDEEDDEDGEDGDEYEGEEGGEEGDWDEEGLSDVQEDEEEEG